MADGYKPTTNNQRLTSFSATRGNVEVKLLANEKAVEK